MNRIKILITAALTALMVSCTEKPVETVEYLDVNANNISGKWELVEWNGSSLTEGTYVYLNIVRNDRTYTMYQNLDSFTNVLELLLQCRVMVSTNSLTMKIGWFVLL